MCLKHNFVTTFLLITTCIFALCCKDAAATHCSLDRMKKFAMEACEHLFEFEELEVRAKRSIFTGHNRKQDTRESTKYGHYIRRSIFPDGGYLKVGQEHYHKLSQIDVSPRYKAKKPTQIMMHHHHHDKKRRYKREDKEYHNYSNNILYCCYNKCEEDFFC